MFLSRIQCHINRGAKCHLHALRLVSHQCSDPHLSPALALSFAALVVAAASSLVTVRALSPPCSSPLQPLSTVHPCLDINCSASQISPAALFTSSAISSFCPTCPGNLPTNSPLALCTISLNKKFRRTYEKHQPAPNRCSQRCAKSSSFKSTAAALSAPALRIPGPWQKHNE